MACPKCGGNNYNAMAGLWCCTVDYKFENGEDEMKDDVEIKTEEVSEKAEEPYPCLDSVEEEINKKALNDKQAFRFTIAFLVALALIILVAAGGIIWMIWRLVVSFVS